MSIFDHLSDLDFEELVADLFSAATRLDFRSGTAGADRGIDVLAVGQNRERHIIQCKHYRHSSYPMLVRAAKKEAARLAEWGNRPASYRFVTSRRLTHANREELAEVLSPYASSSEMIFGESDLERLLGCHQAVEQRHVKLWLWRSAQLTRMLNAQSYNRSRALLDEARAGLPRYVQTGTFEKARQMLADERVLIIAGPPGVGKTTLARLLLLDCVESGAQPYDIVAEAFSDAWAALSFDEDQVFYFDDFLGQTSLEAGRLAYADLLRFMGAVAKKPGARLVMATREYLLREARQLSEAIALASTDSFRFTLRLSEYSRLDRARIFYTHIWASPDIDDLSLASLLADRGYLLVVDHDAYNPRLIEWITGLGLRKLSPAERGNYLDFCLGTLSRPRVLWTHAFEVGISEQGRALLSALPGLPDRVTLSALEMAFTSACRARSLSTAGRSYVKTLEILDDSFLTIVQLGMTAGVSAINPSLLDFLEDYFERSPEDAAVSLRAAVFFEQVEWLANRLWVNHQAHEPEVFAAYKRTLTVPTPESLAHDGEGNLAPADGRGLTESRLWLIARTLGLWPAENNRPWLRHAAEQWGLKLQPQDVLTGKSLELVALLIRHGLLRADAVIAAVLEEIDARPPLDPVDRFDCLSRIFGLDASAFPPLRWQQEQGLFEEFVMESLADPVEVIAGLGEWRRLLNVAEGMMIEVDHDAAAEAERELDEWAKEVEQHEVIPGVDVSVLPDDYSEELRPDEPFGDLETSELHDAPSEQGPGVAASEEWDDAIREMFARLSGHAALAGNDNADEDDRGS